MPTTNSVLGAIRGPTSTLSVASITTHPVRPPSSASSRAHNTIPASRAVHIANDPQVEPFTTVFGAVPSRADLQDERRFAVYFSPTNASDYELTPLRCGTVEPPSFWELRRRSTLEVLGTIRKEGLKATTGKVGKSVAKHVEDVGKIAKDVPLAVKEAQVKLSSKRAKSKIRWLEKRNYLSCQERFLTQELVG
ncbi:hypothetical protein P3342_010233 [Pyrenophora teres f. teres]|nr:hypothetical protein P3342_010233 [Pyrenophora teres f. teres]